MFHFNMHREAKNMARDVHDVLVNTAKEEGNMAEKEATDFVKKLSNKGRYSVDVW